MSKKDGIPYEFDDHPIPPYNPNLTDEEREEGRRKAIEDFRRTVERIREEALAAERNRKKE